MNYKLKTCRRILNFSCGICTEQLSTDKCLSNTFNKLTFMDVLCSFIGEFKVLTSLLKDFNNASLLKVL